MLCTRKGNGRSWLLAAGLGFAAGLAAALAPSAGADQGGKDPPQAFLSGSQRSLVVLQDIKDVLERMDGRLEQIEKHLSRQAAAAGSLPGADSTRRSP